MNTFQDKRHPRTARHARHQGTTAVPKLRDGNHLAHLGVKPGACMSAA
jgi:hypothetical protein